MCNEIVGINNRVLAEVNLPTPLGLSLLAKQFDSIRRRMRPLVPWTLEEVANSFKGRRKMRYLAALESFRESFLQKRDARVTAFIKAEKGDPAHKINPDPRIIQFRNARYCLAFGRYTKPLESQVYKLKTPRGTRFVAKGLNLLRRGQLIEKKFSMFSQPVVYSLDCSRFDQHVDLSVVKLKHKLYSTLFKDPELDQLLRWQWVSKCATRNGVKYTLSGKVLSGEMDTAVGDCLIMIVMLSAALKYLGLADWDALDDGDDCLLFVNKCDEGKLEGLSKIFEEFGHELKLENRAECLEKIKFCQTKPVRVGGVTRMVRDWKRSCSQLACGFRYWDQPHLVKGMLNAVGLCELSLSAGVPILQSFAKSLIRSGDGSIPKGFADDEFEYTRMLQEVGSIDKIRSMDVAWSTRESFALAYGVEPLEQIRIEDALDNWVVEGTISELSQVELRSNWVQDVNVSILGADKILI